LERESSRRCQPGLPGADQFHSLIVEIILLFLVGRGFQGFGLVTLLVELIGFDGEPDQNAEPPAIAVWSRCIQLIER